MKYLIRSLYIGCGFFLNEGRFSYPQSRQKWNKNTHTHTQLSTNQASIKRTLYRTCCVATKFNINLSLECYNKERERERHANRARFQWNRACFRLAFLHFDHVLNQSNPKQIQTNSNESYDYEIENVWHFPHKLSPNRSLSCLLLAHWIGHKVQRF